MAEVVVDDGIDQDRLYQMTAKLRRRTFDFEVSEAQFAAMNWISKHLGAKAIVQVGLSSREHVHNAIQYLSEDVQLRSVYAHTGWRHVDDQAVYLHGGGGLGSQGPVEDTRTRLDGGLNCFTSSR